MENDFLEKTVEDIIFENKEIIHERGFIKFHEHTLRQFVLPTNRIVDLFSYEISGTTLKLQIVEIKRGKIDMDSIWQILTYYYTISQLTAGLFKTCEPQLIILGSDVSDQAAMIHDAGINIEYYLYKYDYNGIQFKKCNQHSFQSYYELDLTPPVEAVHFTKKLKEPYGIDFSPLCDVGDVLME